MLYAMLLKSHANVRYQQSMVTLALQELHCLLKAYNIDAEPRWSKIEGEDFIVFDSDEISDNVFSQISNHSMIRMCGVLTDDSTLQIRKRTFKPYLERELPEILKYKGKTNVDFTMLMLHCAKSASIYASSTEPLTVLDPLCGKATTLFCAMVEGYNAIGIEQDSKAISESLRYFERFLQTNRYIYKASNSSKTVQGHGHARCSQYNVARTREEMKANEGRSLTIYNGDTRDAHILAGKNKCHLIVADLPYGIAHAPHEGRKMSSFSHLIEQAMKGYKLALKKGGAIALAFNEYTITHKQIATQLDLAGFEVLTEPPYNDFSHWVEQALQRNIIIARLP